MAQWFFFRTHQIFADWLMIRMPHRPLKNGGGQVGRWGGRSQVVAQPSLKHLALGRPKGKPGSWSLSYGSVVGKCGKVEVPCQIPEYWTILKQSKQIQTTKLTATEHSISFKHGREYARVDQDHPFMNSSIDQPGVIPTNATVCWSLTMLHAHYIIEVTSITAALLDWT